MSILPTKKTGLRSKLTDQNILIYGAPKIGKTTLASQFDNALFLATEDGQKHVEVFKNWIGSYDDFRRVANELMTANHGFKTIVFDVVDWFLKYLEADIAKRFGQDDISDLEFGKGYNKTKLQIADLINKFNGKGMSCIFLSHDKEKETKKKNISFTTVGTSMSPSQEKIIAGLCDLILFCYEDSDGKRKVRTKPSKYILAGDRSGSLPETMPLDYNELKSKFEVK